MENLYCTIFIVDISQNPDEVETINSRIQQLIEDHGGIIKKIDHWGKRRLAYLVRKKSHGFYVEIEFTANSRLNIPKILEAEYRLNDRVLRYFTYVVTKKELLQRQLSVKAKPEVKEPELKAKPEVKEPELKAVNKEEIKESKVGGKDDAVDFFEEEIAEKPEVAEEENVDEQKPAIEENPIDDSQKEGGKE
jgi:small subunit ribosomal protein S6